MEHANPLDVCFTVLKIRYADYDRTITNADFIHSPKEAVNVFIDLESVFKNLTTIQDLEQKLISFRGFEYCLASNILNLAGHYRRFFRGNGIKCTVYLYHTSFESEDFKQCEYNSEYRSYYNCKYAQNPKFVYLTDALRDTVLPTVRTCCEFLNGVHYICTENIEGSIVPYVIDQMDQVDGIHAKNFILTNEVYNTQYNYLPNFLVHLIRRGYGMSFAGCDKKDILSIVGKCTPEEAKACMESFQTYGTFVTLLASLGDKERSIEKLPGIGFKSLDGLIRKAKANQRITDTTTSPEILAEIFLGEGLREEFIKNYRCTSIKEIYGWTSSADRLMITSQRKDRFDNQGLLELNQTLFQNYPLTLESLCM